MSYCPQQAYSGLGRLYSTLSYVKREHLKKAAQALLEATQQTDIEVSSSVADKVTLLKADLIENA